MSYRNVKIEKSARIAKQSIILGDVTIGRDSCVLYYAVIRGDDAPVTIGAETNIQENCTIHVSHNMPVHIGNNVTIGHNAVIHGARIGDNCLIGMGATLLDNAVVPSGCIIAANALVLSNAQLEPNSVYAGVPAKKVKEVTPQQREEIIRRTARDYMLYASWFKEEE